MRYASIRSLDVTNGEGIGVSLFTQGCPFHCHNCFNPDTWDFNGGREWNEDIEKQFLNLIDKPHIKRISILGGEPLANENASDVLNLIKKIKSKYPEKSIWLYTGYTFEKLCEMYCNEQIYNYLTNNTNKHIVFENLFYVDVLVDGQYIEAQRDITLAFRGSKNQRLIDVKETLKQNQIVLYNTTK